MFSCILPDHRHGHTGSAREFWGLTATRLGRYFRIMQKPILTSVEVAALLNVDRKTLRKWVRGGLCPVTPLPGIEPPKWRRADVEAFVAGQAA